MGPDRRALTLAPDEIAALAARHGLAAGPNSALGPFIGTKPKAGTHGLRARSLLDDGWRQALTVLARPEHQVRLLIPGPAESVILVYYGSRAPGSDGLVACSATGEGLKVSFPWTARDLAATTALTLLPTSPPAPESFSTLLTPAGLTALVAVIDVARAALFDSLQRRLPHLEPRITLHDVMDHLQVGISHNDARWLVTLLTVIASPFVPLVPRQLGEGLAELQAGGLLARDGEGWRPAPILQRLAVHCRSPLPAAAHEVIAMRGDEVKLVRHRVAIRGDGPLWILDYQGILDGVPRVSIRSVDPADYLEGLVDMIEAPRSVEAASDASVRPSRRERAPVKPPGTRQTRDASRAEPTSGQPRRPETAGQCPSCGAPRSPGKRFCTRCGTRLHAE